MLRVTEPEIMLDSAQSLAYYNYDRSKTKNLVKNFYQLLLPSQVNSIVDLGCGPGDLTLDLARLHPEATVVGIDGSDAMLALAGVNTNVSFQRLTIGTDAIGNYDRVVSSMTLHHFHDANVFWNAIKDIDPKDVFVFDLIRPNSEEELQSYIELNGPYDNIEFQNDFENSLRAAFTFEEISQQLTANGLNMSITKFTRNQTRNFEMIIVSGELNG